MRPSFVVIAAVVARGGLAFADSTPPAFAGVEGVAAAGPASLSVRWTPARDDRTPASLMRDYVCRSTVAKECARSFKGAIVVTGVAEATLSGLAPATKYHVVVRAE